VFVRNIWRESKPAVILNFKSSCCSSSLLCYVMIYRFPVLWNIKMFISCLRSQISHSSIHVNRFSSVFCLIHLNLSTQSWDILILKQICKMFNFIGYCKLQKIDWLQLKEWRKKMRFDIFLKIEKSNWKNIKSFSKYKKC
jgi:hypothetical protein